MKIYCLFSVANNYDQPDYNLVAFWHTQPSLKDLKVIFGEWVDDEMLIKLSLGSDVKWYDTEYRIEEVKSGVIVGGEL